MLLYSFWSMCSPSSSASRVVVILIGIAMALESSILNFLTMSLVYLSWCTNVPSFDCFICSPRKNYNSPIMLISNSLLISSTNLATRELDEPPKTISSTYTCTIRTSLPYLRRNKVRSTFPISNPLSNRNALNLPYQALLVLDLLFLTIPLSNKP
jgi:hypothetical protein